MKSDILRPLDLIEKAFYIYSDDHPVHFCLVADISGEIDVSKFAPGLMAVQSRHPTLAALIEKDAEGHPVFRRAIARPIPITFAPLGRQTDWRSFVKNELAMPFAADPGPPMRVTVLHRAERAIVIFTFNHAVADALSGVRVLTEFLLILDGDLPPPSPDARLSALLERALVSNGEGIEAKLPAEVDAEALRGIAALPLWGPPNDDGFDVETNELDQATTTRLLARCRSERTTLHGALSAAVVQCAAGHNRLGSFDITSPVDLRTLIDQDARNSLGCLVGRGSVTYQLERGDGFWGLARETSRDLRDARSTATVIAGLSASAAATSNAADSSLVRGLWGALPMDAFISNLGVLQVPSQFASIELDALWGPAMRVHLKNDLVIGVATFGGRLRLTQTRANHVRSDLAEICGALKYNARV